MRHSARQCAGLLLILLANAACHKDSSVALYSSLYSGDYILNPVAMLEIANSDSPLLLAESYGSYISGLPQMETIASVGEVATAGTNNLDNEILPLPSSLFHFPYDISLMCMGMPCEGVMLSGSAELIIDLGEKSVSLEGIDARSADNKFHLTASMKSDSSLSSTADLFYGLFTEKDMNTYELRKSVIFVLADKYTKETLADKIIPEIEMRIDATAGFYFKGEGIGLTGQ